MFLVNQMMSVFSDVAFGKNAGKLLLQESGVALTLGKNVHGSLLQKIV